MHRKPLLPLTLLASLLSVLLLTPAPGASAASPGWLVRCPLSHTAPEDPIAMPGTPGGTHDHDFFGNTSTGAFSTQAGMSAAATTCGTAADSAAYWTPTLVRNGIAVRPAGSYAGRSTRQQIYYRDNAVNAGTPVEPFPADLRMIAGNSRATSAAGNPQLGRELYWGCSGNTESGKPTAPVDCPSGIVTLHIGFPSCWNGVLSHRDDTANMAYPSGGRCPSAFPRLLPRLIERFEYPVGTSSAGLTLSSGPSWTVHADFWNTWQQPALAGLVERCLNLDTDCGTNPAA